MEGTNSLPPKSNTLQKGRGAQLNTANRFSKHTKVVDENFDGIDEADDLAAKTTFLPVQARTILNPVPSPDIPLLWSANPYQGCEHGCIYCYARPTHEYLGYSAGIDFESKIQVKLNSPALLRAAFSKPTWRGEAISLSGNTDCYQPAERTYGLTRQLLEACLL